MTFKKYLATAKEQGFELLREYDQTENTMPTLDYGKYFINRFVEPTIDYISYSSKKAFLKWHQLLVVLLGQNTI